MDAMYIRNQLEARFAEVALDKTKGCTYGMYKKTFPEVEHIAIVIKDSEGYCAKYFINKLFIDDCIMNGSLISFQEYYREVKMKT